MRHLLAQQRVWRQSEAVDESFGIERETRGSGSKKEEIVTKCEVKGYRTHDNEDEYHGVQFFGHFVCAKCWRGKGRQLGHDFRLLAKKIGFEIPILKKKIRVKVRKKLK